MIRRCLIRPFGKRTPAILEEFWGVTSEADCAGGLFVGQDLDEGDAPVAVGEDVDELPTPTPGLACALAACAGLSRPLRSPMTQWLGWSDFSPFYAEKWELDCP